MLAFDCRPIKNLQLEVFFAIMQIYARQNNATLDMVLDIVFKELSEPIQDAKLRDLALSSLSDKHKDEEVDAQKYPNVAFLKHLNLQVMEMLGLSNLENEIMRQAN